MGEFSAYVARPRAAAAPAVVVIQEIFGVNAVMREIADHFADAGYLAVCPDLFWRIEPGIDISDRSEAEWKRAFELYNAFDVEAGVQRHRRHDRSHSPGSDLFRQGRGRRLLPRRPARLFDRHSYGRRRRRRLLRRGHRPLHRRIRSPQRPPAASHR